MNNPRFKQGDRVIATRNKKENDDEKEFGLYNGKPYPYIGEIGTIKKFFSDNKYSGLEYIIDWDTKYHGNANLVRDWQIELYPDFKTEIIKICNIKKEIKPFYDFLRKKRYIKRIGINKLIAEYIKEKNNGN